MSKLIPIALGVMAAIASPVRAENPRVNTETFRPSPHARDLFATLTSDVPAPGAWSFGFWLAYGMNPLVFVDALDRAPDHEAIQHQLTATPTAALVLTDSLSVGLAVPVLLLNDGDDAGFVPLDPIPSAGLGDVRLSVKIGIVRRARDSDGLGLVLELPIGFPTGDGDAFISDGWSFVPAIGLDLRAGGFVAALNLGARFREEVELAGGTTIGREAVFRVAASYDLVPDVLTLLAEVQGASHNFELKNNTYVEGLLGGRLALGDGFFVTLAGGRGFVEGYGSTAAKVVASFGYAEPDPVIEEPPPIAVMPEPEPEREPLPPPPEPDADGDGIVDRLDDCPNDPTNKCGVEVDLCEIKIDQTIYFAYDDDKILSKSFEILDAVGALFASRDTLARVEVQGHTDSFGSNAYNLDLSQRRAEAVVAYLVGKGVAPGRLVPVGYGETRPIVSNDSGSQRAKNRRVQFIILDPVQIECR